MGTTNIRGIDGIIYIFIDEGLFKFDLVSRIFKLIRDGIVATFWYGPEIMEDPWNIGYRLNKDRISLSEMSAQIINEASEILFFRTVVEWKKNKIGGDKKDEEEKLEPKEPSQIENLYLNGIEGEKEHDKKEGKEIDKISGSDEMGDVE